MILGVNNRDLARFVTDLSVTEKLFPLIPENIIKVSESGILSLKMLSGRCGSRCRPLRRSPDAADNTESFIAEMKALEE